MSTKDALTAERSVAQIKRDHATGSDQRWWSGYTEGLEFALALLDLSDDDERELERYRLFHPGEIGQ